MEKSLSIGKITVHFPDHNSKEFSIFEDLASLFNIETNYDAEQFLKKKIKENGITKKIDFDSEGDFVSIRTRNASLILDIAFLINELANISIDKVLKKEYKKILSAVKPPNKQKWGLGDIFLIPLEDGTNYFGQIVELIEGVFPICVVFNFNNSDMPSIGEIVSSEIIAALSISTSYLNDYTIKVILKSEPSVQIQKNIRRDPIRRTQYSGSTLFDFCNDFKKKSTKFYSFTENLEYVIR
jgi:hypothetical protein